MFRPASSSPSRPLSCSRPGSSFARSANCTVVSIPAPASASRPGPARPISPRSNTPEGTVARTSLSRRSPNDAHPAASRPPSPANASAMACGVAPAERDPIPDLLPQHVAHLPRDAGKSHIPLLEPLGHHGPRVLLKAGRARGRAIQHRSQQPGRGRGYKVEAIQPVRLKPVVGRDIVIRDLRPHHVRLPVQRVLRGHDDDRQARAVGGCSTRPHPAAASPGCSPCGRRPPPPRTRRAGLIPLAACPASLPG